MKVPVLYFSVAFLSATTPITCFLVPAQRQRISPRLFYRTSDKEHSEYSVVTDTPKKEKVEYAALSPGCTSVEIQVGDVSLARKAWKKRRRSGSPLLVPCSILSIDTRSMLQWNIVYLLQKFGTPLKDIEQSNQVGFIADGICLAMRDIKTYYERHLGTSLVKHAKALGYETARSLVQELFDSQAQKDLGVFLWSPGGDDSPMWLMSPLSKQRAHRMASQAGLLQFASPSEDDETTDDTSNDNDTDIDTTADTNDDNSNRMEHTGVLRIRNKESKRPRHLFVPLSAALRVTSVDAIHNGQVYNSAVVFSLDHFGDGGSPLLILSLNPTRSQVRDRAKLKAVAKRQFSESKRIEVLSSDAVYKFEDLKIGQGPIKAKVIRMSTRSKAAFVDCGVGRTTKDGKTVRVLGMLRFDDLLQSSLNKKDNPDESNAEGKEDDVDITNLLTVNDDGTVSFEDPETGENVVISEMDVGSPSDDENDSDSMFTGLSTQERLDLLAKVVKDEQPAHDHDHEEEMDITHLVSTENGVMSYKDPETGESIIISDESIDDGDEEDQEDEDGDDDDDALFKNMSPEERLEMISDIMNGREEATRDDEMSTVSSSSDSFQPAFVKVGDEVEVYIKSVYKQSGRFMVTLDPPVQGRKAKDVKKESEAEKKLARLAEKLGGLERIAKLEGTECEGVVQAISKTGDWCYVKPSIDDIPVGVATLSSDEMALSKGDTVQVRLDGIDESRGQLAMTVI